MEYKSVGNLTVPVIGIGTWRGIWGEKSYPEKSLENDKNTIKTIRYAISNDITHIDTASMYGAGYAEEQIGKAIKGFDRHALFIATKVKGSDLDYDSVIRSAKASLKRLNTSYIDLFFIHWFNNDTPLSETISALDDLVDEGLIKNIGVSNFSLEQLKAAEDLSKYKISAVQVEYNLERRDNGRHSENVESEILPYCQKNDILIVAYKSFAEGSLAKRGYNSLIDELCLKYNKTPAQISLNWALSKKNIVVIPRTTNFNHMLENLASVGWVMEKEDLARLDNFQTD